MENGLNEEAMQLMDRLEEYVLSVLESDVGRRDINILALVSVYCLRNQNEKALEYLRQIEWRSLKPLWWIITLEDYIFFEPIRADPEYQLILNTLKNTWQEEHWKVRNWMVENDLL